MTFDNYFSILELPDTFCARNIDLLRGKTLRERVYIFQTRV